VTGADRQLIGTISDGDLRRHFDDLPGLTARELMVTHPVTLDVGADVGEALLKMRTHRISALFVVAPGTLIVEGLVHLQDLLRVGVI
jgi:arabinose-5-phosphate isomerase